MIDRCPSCSAFLAISDYLEYGKCFPCFLVEGRSVPVQGFDPRNLLGMTYNDCLCEFLKGRAGKCPHEKPPGRRGQKYA